MIESFNAPTSLSPPYANTDIVDMIFSSVKPELSNLTANKQIKHIPINSKKWIGILVIIIFF